MNSSVPVHSLPPTRRRFLQCLAAAGTVAGFPHVARAARPNRKLQLAAVGMSGMGFNDLHNLVSHPEVKYVGFCDVDRTAFAKADELAPGVPHFQDFRTMFEVLGDQIDAVNVAIPDHMHALVAIEAMKRGKHVYCQKPLAHTVWEARQMRLWAEKKNVVTQMGNQIHSALEYRLGTRLIKDGAIGRVKEVYSWVSVTGNERTRLLEPPPSGAVPAHLNWDLWLGGAPERPYAPGVYHPFAWRDWQDFGGGAIGDFGCHVLDPVFTALRLKAPISVAAENTGVNRHIWPTSQVVRFVFPGNELCLEKTLRVTWSDGGVRPERKLATMPDDRELPGTGSLFVGESGNMVLPHGGGPRLYPLEKYKGFQYPKDVQKLNHWHRWIDAILSGGRTSDGFDYAGPLSEAVQLGNVATRVVDRSKFARGTRSRDPADENTLHWDAAQGRITNHALADSLLTKRYRAGWEVPAA